MDKSPKIDIFTAQNLKELSIGFQRIRILFTAYELNLFTALGNKNRAAEEISKILKTNKRSTLRLMNALCVLGLLKKKNNKFSNTNLSLRFLVKGSPDFMAGFRHFVNMWDSWSTLTEAVKKGTSVIASRPDKRGKAWLNAFIAAMHERACQQAQEVISFLNLSGVSSILDVGGGSGAYTMAFLRFNKKIRAVIFDLPAVIPLTRNYIKQEGFSGKIKTVSGDYITDDFNGSFDLVFLSAIVHSNSFKENSALIRKCVKVLNPGGQIVIQDFIMDDGRIQPSFGAFFALNMLVATEKGDTYTESEARQWLKDAGISKIIRKNTSFGTSLIIGRKESYGALSNKYHYDYGD